MSHLLHFTITQCDAGLKHQFTQKKLFPFITDLMFSSVSGQGEGRCPTHLPLKIRRDRWCRCRRISVAIVSPENLCKYADHVRQSNDASSRKQSGRVLPRNPVGPEGHFSVCTQNSRSFPSSPSSHGPPAGLHNRAASGDSGHAPHSHSGEGETVSVFVWLTCWLPVTDGLPLHTSVWLLSGFHQQCLFSVWFCSPGGSGLILKSLTSGTTASTITPQAPGCALPPVRTVNHFHVYDWVGWFIYWLIL